MTLHARPATAEDFPSFARLYPELGTGDPLPSETAWNTTQRPTTRIYELEGSVVAYAYFERMRELAYIRNIVVDPAHRGRGLGRELMRLLADELRAAGCTAWRLNVDPRNTAALRLYQRVGLRPRYRSFAVRFDWPAVDLLPADDLPLGTCPIDPLDDPALESTFDLPPGQLASLRAKPGRLNLRLHDPADPAAALGFASFDPAFPGAYPFRVVRPGLAPALLRALRPHAPAGTCMLVVEDDEPLYTRLLAVGAALRLEISHLRGDLI
jgi:GNAT superfamily N-acetyltransferase